MSSSKVYQVVKTYGHERGLSCAFRQWRADHSHCSLLHGYAISVEVCFEAETLDARNWVVDFGGMDEFKKWLEETFDHKTLVAADDPEILLFREMFEHGIIELRIVPAVGCERFAQLIYECADLMFAHERVRVKYVKVAEHGSNAAVYGEK